MLALILGGCGTTAVGPGGTRDLHRLDRDESLAAMTLVAEVRPRPIPKSQNVGPPEESKADAVDQPQEFEPEAGSAVVIAEDTSFVYVLAPLHLFCDPKALDDKACEDGVRKEMLNLYSEFSDSESRELVWTGLKAPGSDGDWIVLKTEIEKRPWFAGRRAWERLSGAGEVSDGQSGRLLTYCRQGGIPCLYAGTLRLPTGIESNKVAVSQAYRQLRPGEAAPANDDSYKFGGPGTSGGALFTENWHLVGMHVEGGGGAETRSLLLTKIFEDQQFKNVKVCLVGWRPFEQTHRRMRSWGWPLIVGGAIVAGAGLLTAASTMAIRRWDRPSGEEVTASWVNGVNDAIWIGLLATGAGLASIAAGDLLYNKSFMLPPVPACGE
jgi:hypothetical protein